MPLNKKASMVKNKKTINKSKSKTSLKNTKYFVYIIRCVGDRLYTGITNDIKKRFSQHKGDIKGGAKFTKAFKPVKIEKTWKVKNKSEALKIEYKIKQLSKSEKEDLIKEKNEKLKL